jgi:hypothetical protein
MEKNDKKIKDEKKEDNGKAAKTTEKNANSDAKIDEEPHSPKSDSDKKEKSTKNEIKERNTEKGSKEKVHEDEGESSSTTSSLDHVAAVSFPFPLYISLFIIF